jgi:cullin-associated NEDD8-dissociated protein 1
MQPYAHEAHGNRTRPGTLAPGFAFRIVLAVKPKENAVKQEIEKIHEGAKGVLKVSIQINKQMGTEAGVGQDDSQLRVWAQYWDQIQKEHEKGLKAVAEELKERDR